MKRKSNSFMIKNRSKFESSYLKQIRQCLRIFIENERVNLIEEILSSSNYLIPNEFNFLPTNKKFKLFKKINWSEFYVDKEMKDNALHYASRLGKTCLIDLLIDSGFFGVNDLNFERDSPLCIACDLGWLDTAKILISRGADLNYENPIKNKTPLILSTELIEPFDTQMCKLLVSSGALVNYTTRNRNTALLSASKFGNIALIDLLIKANSNINSQFNDGATCLMRACYYNHYKLVEYLLDKNADTELKNLRKETALYIASFRGNLEIVKLLVEKYNANLNTEDVDGDTPLSVACYESKSRVVNYLLTKGANVNKKGIRGDTPLHIAVANCGLIVVQELIKYGASPDLVNDDLETPLHILVKHNRNDLLENILLVTNNLDQLSIKNKTALKELLENLNLDKLKMVISLIRHGCDLNKSVQNHATFEFLFKLQQTKLNENFIQLIINFMFLIFNSGLRLNINDLRLFKQTWLWDYLEEKKMLDLKQKFEFMLSKNINEPDLLKNLCRIKIRKIINKPITKSILKLNIPNDLKLYLNFQNFF